MYNYFYNFHKNQADSHADSDSSNPVERGPKRGSKKGPKRSSSGTVNKRGSTGSSFKRHKSTSEENNFEDDFEPPVMEVRLKPIIPSLTKPSTKSSSEESANDGKLNFYSFGIIRNILPSYFGDFLLYFKHQQMFLV